MTIDEAIESSQEAAVYLSIHHQDRLAKGAMLGIEALKHLKGCWGARECDRIWLLPGETEE